MTKININKIKIFMESRKIKEPELAVMMGISRSYLFRVLRGNRNAGGKFIEGLVRAGMLPEQIFLPNSLPKGNNSDKKITKVITGTDG